MSTEVRCDVCQKPSTGIAIIAAEGVQSKKTDDLLLGMPARYMDLCDNHRADLVENWGGFGKEWGDW